MIFSRMEDFLEKNIEGFFNRKFSSQLQIPELQKMLDRVLMRRQKRLNRAIFVPDSFVITMSEADFTELNSAETKNQLKLYLCKAVIEKDFFMAHKLTLNILKSPDLKLGMCDIKASFSKPITVQSVSENTTELDQGTIIVPQDDLKQLVKSPRISQELKLASLTVIDGPDKDSYLEIGDRQVHIGRREKNEFIVTDPNVSRLHAYIAFENGRHILHDAGSLNGTYVNGRQITGFCLCPGDKIRLASTVILYELL